MNKIQLPEGALTIRVTERQIFKRCRRRWGYAFRDMLQPKDSRSDARCTSSDTIIELADGSMVEAGTLIDKEFEIVSFDEKTLERRVSKAFAYDNGIKPIVKITLESGKVLKRTYNHPLLVPEVYKGPSTGGRAKHPYGWKWKHCGDIVVGEHVLTPKERILNSMSPIKNDNELKIIAYLIGDGCTSHPKGYETKFSQGNDYPLILEEFIESVQNIGGHVLKTKEHGYSVSNIRPVVLKYMIEGKIANQKSIPELVWQCTDTQLKLFLSRLYATDGYASTAVNTGGAGTIGYCTTSYRLAHDVIRALSRLGVHAFITTAHAPWSPLTMTPRRGISFKLSDADILEIRHIYKSTTTSYDQLARQFKCSKGYINNVLNNRISDRSRSERSLPGNAIKTGESSIFKVLISRTDDVIKFVTTIGIYGKENATSTILKKALNIAKYKRTVDRHLSDDFKCSWEKVKSVEFIDPEPTVAISVPGDNTYITPDAMEHNTIGTVGHACLAEYYKAIKNDMGIDSGIWNLWETFRIHNSALEEDQVTMLRSVLEHYIATYAGEEEKDGWKILAVEEPFYAPVPGLENVYLEGRPDLVVEIPYKGIVGFDHKFYRSLLSEVKLEFDDQQTLYTWLLKQNDVNVTQAMYNMIRKKVPAEPEPLKNGSLSKNKNIDTTQQRYLAAIKRNGLDPADYLDILEKIGNNEFFRREPIRKSFRQLQKVQEMLTMEASEMTNPATHIYPNLDINTCAMCDFTTLCNCESDDGDVAMTKKFFYIRTDMVTLNRRES